MVWIVDVIKKILGGKEVKRSRKQAKKKEVKKKTTQLKNQKHIKKKLDTVNIETPVSSVMISDVKTVKPEDSLREALETLSEYNLGGLPVVSKNKIVGVISETDIIRVMNVENILDAKKDKMKLSMLQRFSVADAMSKKPISINQDAKITHASDLMAKHNINRLIVTDKKDNLVGIITKGDLIKALSSEVFSKLISKEAGKIIETKVDSLIKIIENQGSANVNELSKKLNVDREHIELWGKILEQRGLIEMRYPPFGPAILRKKK